MLNQGRLYPSHLFAEEIDRLLSRHNYKTGLHLQDRIPFGKFKHGNMEAVRGQYLRILLFSSSIFC